MLNESAGLKNHLRASYLSALAAIGVASCCVLPMLMLLLGLGGSWLAVFGRIAGASPYVLALSSAMVALAWLVAYRRGSLSRHSFWLAGSTTLTVLAWLLFLSEARINTYLMTWM